MIDLFITTCIQRLHSSAHSCTRLHTTSAFICTLLHTSACYVHQLHVCTIYFCIDVWRTMPAYNHLVHVYMYCSIHICSSRVGMQ